MSLLRRRGLGPLLVAEIVSSFGSQMTFLALPWFVLVSTGSAARMGLVLAVELLPVALLGIPSGELIARVGARQTMLIGDIARAPLIAAIPLLHAAELLTFPLLLGIVFLVGCFLAPYFSAQRLILPELVGDDEATVAQANVWVEGAQRISALVGPATAGVLIAAMGASSVLYIDAATFALSALTLAALVPRRPPVAPGDEGHGVLAGVRYVLRDRLLAPISRHGADREHVRPDARRRRCPCSRTRSTAAAPGSPACSSPRSALAPSSAPCSRCGSWGGSSRCGSAAIGLVGAYGPLFVLVLNPPVWGVVAVLAVSAAFGPLVNAPLLGLITTRTPEAVRAKVMTAVITFAMLAGPLGLLVVGPMLEAWGPLAVLLIVAIGELAAALAFAAFTLRRSAAGAYAPAMTVD